MQVNVGKGITLDVNVNDLAAPVMAHVVYIGLRNILMDAHASAKTPAEAVAMSEKKLAAMLAGEMRTTSARESDPVRARVKAIVKKGVETTWRKSGKKLADITDADRERIEKLFDLAAITALAERQVADERALNVDVTL